MHSLLDLADVSRLREALVSADFTEAGTSARLGEDAAVAAGRGDFRAALAATSDSDAQATLIRLFVCGVVEPADAVARALAPLPIEAAQRSGLVLGDAEGYRAGVALEIYGDHWLLSDLPAAPGCGLDAEHVLGVGSAAATLAGAVMRDDVDSALDLGAGSGIQALHLSRHARRVAVSDVSPRAMRFAAANA
ncbi:MAG: DUF7059 domain-containing protein, partial [Stackebrandtia sp.]